ncbi:MAG: hypothetical protein GXY87_07270 [Tissierellia bacterium]|nr:hypothetical protein [Tissierellia bacterium]
MKEKILKFFSGRYGGDELTKFITYVVLAILIVRIFMPSDLLYVVALVLIVFANFRVLSKDFVKRRAENQWFLTKTSGLKNTYTKYKNRIFGKDGYKYFECSGCKSELKVPKKRGKVKVRCPKCNTEMIKRT